MQGFGIAFPRDYHSVDANLASGIIGGGRSANMILEVHKDLTIAMYSVIVLTEELSMGQGLVSGLRKCIIHYQKQHS